MSDQQDAKFQTSSVDVRPASSQHGELSGVAKKSDSAPSMRVVTDEVSKFVVGQQQMIDHILIGLLTEGHILLEGFPGLAKTLTVSTLAKTVDLNFQRIQFTPDLLPTDLIGTMIFNPQTGQFTTKKGPLFTNIVLADEINRSPAKVQSALLEAMAERQVTIGEKTYPIERPFLVLATQNPLEQDGTYPLPEAQLDRFMFKVLVSYPSKEEELEILNRMTYVENMDVASVLRHDDLKLAQEKVRLIHIEESLKNYIVDIVTATRSLKAYGIQSLEGMLQVGVSPRATLDMRRAAQGHAFLKERDHVNMDDIKAVVASVLRHRLILSYEAEAENVTADDVVSELLSHIEV